MNEPQYLDPKLAAEILRPIDPAKLELPKAMLAWLKESEPVRRANRKFLQTIFGGRAVIGVVGYELPAR